MPDVTLIVEDLGDAPEAERLERALMRLDFVSEANADAEKSLVAVSYEGGEKELKRLGQAVKEAGHEFEHSTGSKRISD